MKFVRGRVSSKVLHGMSRIQDRYYERTRAKSIAYRYVYLFLYYRKKKQRNGSTGFEFLF